MLRFRVQETQVRVGLGRLDWKLFSSTKRHDILPYYLKISQSSRKKWGACYLAAVASGTACTVISPEHHVHVFAVLP
jgi:hypothetical protein